MQPLDNDYNLHQKFAVAGHNLTERFRSHEEVLVLMYSNEYIAHMTSNHAFINEHTVEEKALSDTSNFPSSLEQL